MSDDVLPVDEDLNDDGDDAVHWAGLTVEEKAEVMASRHVGVFKEDL